MVRTNKNFRNLDTSTSEIRKKSTAIKKYQEIYRLPFHFLHNTIRRQNRRKEVYFNNILLSIERNLNPISLILI